jgi:hypothetical protein
MKLIITLKDPKCCDGCPMMDNIICLKYKVLLEVRSYKNKSPNVIRLKQCVEENGD